MYIIYHSQGYIFRQAFRMFVQVVIGMVSVSLVVSCIWLSCMDTDARAVMARQQAEKSEIVFKIKPIDNILNRADSPIDIANRLLIRINADSTKNIILMKRQAEIIKTLSSIKTQIDSLISKRGQNDKSGNR